jgi:hypothetical protein
MDVQFLLVFFLLKQFVIKSHAHKSDFSFNWNFFIILCVDYFKFLAFEIPFSKKPKKKFGGKKLHCFFDNLKLSGKTIFFISWSNSLIAKKKKSTHDVQSLTENSS